MFAHKTQKRMTKKWLKHVPTSTKQTFLSVLWIEFVDKLIAVKNVGQPALMSQGRFWVYKVYRLKACTGMQVFVGEDPAVWKQKIIVYDEITKTNYDGRNFIYKNFLQLS